MNIKEDRGHGSFIANAEGAGKCSWDGPARGGYNLERESETIGRGGGVREREERKRKSANERVSEREEVVGLQLIRAAGTCRGGNLDPPAAEALS